MSIPNLKEVEWAISELENEETSFSNYAKLANLYTVRDKMLGKDTPANVRSFDLEYSGASSPARFVEQYGDSDFLQTIVGKDPAGAWAVIDDLMDTLRVVNPRVYDSVMRKLRRL